MEQNSMSEKIIRAHGTLNANYYLMIDSALETSDIIAKGLSVQGNLCCRNLWIEQTLKVFGFLKCDVTAEVSGNVFIEGDCHCNILSSKGNIRIKGNFYGTTITSSDDVIIEGKFIPNNKGIKAINNINVPEGKHVYIGGECIK